MLQKQEEIVNKFMLLIISWIQDLMSEVCDTDSFINYSTSIYWTSTLRQVWEYNDEQK